MKNKLCLKVLLAALAASLLLGGCAWMGRTVGKAQAKLERKADSVEQGYEQGYEEEKAKTEKVEQ